MILSKEYAASTFFFFSRVFLVLVVTNMVNELQMGVLSNADQAYVP